MPSTRSTALPVSLAAVWLAASWSPGCRCSGPTGAPAPTATASSAPASFVVSPASSTAPEPSGSHAAPATTLPAGDVGPLCQKLLHEQQALVARTSRAIKAAEDSSRAEAGADDYAVLFPNAALLYPVLGCRERSARGAWAITLSDLVLADDGWDGWRPLSGKVMVVFVDVTGRRWEHELSTFTLGPYGPESGVAIMAARSFDYDADGVPELFLRLAFGDYRLIHDRGTLWTMGRAGIRSFWANDGGIDELRDVDKDGRPDIVTPGPYVASSAGYECNIGAVIDNVRGPALLAHSLPDGTFSMSDAVASQWAEKQCPPAAFHASGETTLTDIACARIRGSTAHELRRSLIERYAPDVTEHNIDEFLQADREHRPAHISCMEQKRLASELRVADTEPPLTLRGR